MLTNLSISMNFNFTILIIELLNSISSKGEFCDFFYQRLKL